MELSSLPRIPNGVALEGFDGAGKSDATTNLAKAGYSVHRSPPERMKKERELFDSSAKTLSERFAFYLSANVAVAQDMLEEGSITISDRHILTTVAAHEAMGLPRVELVEKVVESGLSIPAFSILLTVSEEERDRRLNRRGRNQNDLENDKINAQILTNLFIWAELMNHEVVTLDTTPLNQLEVAEEITQIIQKRLRS